MQPTWSPRRLEADAPSGPTNSASSPRRLLALGLVVFALSCGFAVAATAAGIPETLGDSG